MSKVFQSYCCQTGNWGAAWIGLESTDDINLPDSIGLIELSTGADLSACYMDVSVTPHQLVHRSVSEMATEYLGQYKSDRKRVVDRQAGAIRSQVASQGYGQEMTYLVKEAEARACLADPNPLNETYPLLAAEIGITGPDLNAVAAEVVTKADEWRALAAQIEAVRLTTKTLIDDALDYAGVDAAIKAAIWPSKDN